MDTWKRNTDHKNYLKFFLPQSLLTYQIQTHLQGFIHQFYKSTLNISKEYKHPHFDSFFNRHIYHITLCWGKIGSFSCIVRNINIPTLILLPLSSQPIVIEYGIHLSIRYLRFYHYHHSQRNLLFNLQVICKILLSPLYHKNQLQKSQLMKNKPGYKCE